MLELLHQQQNIKLTEKTMSILTKKTRIYTRFELMNPFAFVSQPITNTINEKVETYYLGRIPVASFTVDTEVVPKNAKFWKSKFDYAN